MTSFILKLSSIKTVKAFRWFQKERIKVMSIMQIQHLVGLESWYKKGFFFKKERKHPCPHSVFNSSIDRISHCLLKVPLEYTRISIILNQETPIIEWKDSMIPMSTKTRWLSTEIQVPSGPTKPVIINVVSTNYRSLTKSEISRNVPRKVVRLLRRVIIKQKDTHTKHTTHFDV